MSDENKEVEFAGNRTVKSVPEEGVRLGKHQTALVWDPEEGFSFYLPDAEDEDAPLPPGTLILAGVFQLLGVESWIETTLDVAFPDGGKGPGCTGIDWEESSAKEDKSNGA